MFLLLIIFNLPLFIFAHIGYSSQSYCLDDISTGKLNLICRDNELIKLGRIIYGYSWSNDCSYIDKDCTMDVPREDIICLTNSNCTVRVVEHPLILQDCWNLAASYVQAEYECVQDYSLKNICQNQDIILSHGFVSTPNYPHGFQSNLNCLCTLIPSGNNSIVLEIIYFNLPICTEAALVLWIGQDLHTKCLQQDPITFISNIQQNITFRFYTLKNNKYGGFLMKYSILPETNNGTIRLQCYLSSSSSIIRSTILNSYSTLKYSLNNKNSYEYEYEKDLSVIHTNDYIKRNRPVQSIIEPYTDIIPMYKQDGLQIINQSTYKHYILPNSNPISRSNLNLIIIFIVSIIVFLIVINVLVWLMCSLRLKSSRSTSSVQNLYNNNKMNINTNEGKRSIHKQFSQRSNRLKSLHSLLYVDHKAVDINPIKTNINRDLDSSLSQYNINSNSSSTNLNQHFIFKSKSTETLQQPRQINSWDDI
ncbi:unnamed protein product [Rotaria sp. Silwood1]|nr:unnamed protein product [Rotaria sp. Silwood1]CAF1613600.1 unnamed protein product [Rotaria sp. Silwood1]CAF3849346.1 unnamed protein product [Rotaria sp. Silwood1]CAF4930818.1 unnamed protein product [Rotaria sp. Silwood1]